MKHGKLHRIVCSVLSALLMVMLIPLNVSAATFKLNYSSLSVTKGYSATLKATGGSNVKWSSSNSKIATVNSKGKVYAKKAGTCTITAKSGSQKVTCKIKVVNGKLSVSQSTVNVESGDSVPVTVTATGSHALKYSSSDSSVATGSWIKPWTGNKITFNVKGVSEGSARIKIYMSKYTSIYKYINVKVTDPDIEVDDSSDEESEGTTTLLTDRTSVSVAKDSTSSVKLYSDNPTAVSVTSGDSSVVTVTAPTWSGSSGTFTLKGIKAGTTTVTVNASDNASLKKVINVTVTSDGYYEISTSPVSKRLATDVLYRWTDAKGTTKYMLLPAGYDIAYVNTLTAKDSGSATYYAVYDSLPDKVDSTDTTPSFNATVNGKTVVRYILLPKGHDIVRYNTEVALYTGKYSYWTIYNSEPQKQISSDVIEKWQSVVSGVTYTRYILLPSDYDTARLASVKEADMTSASEASYYVVTEIKPSTTVSTDTIYSFTYVSGGVQRTAYILLPKDYDKARRDTAYAKYTGNYSYWTVYSEEPVKTASSDTVKSWNRVNDGKLEKRYILLPEGYSNDTLNNIMNDDVNSNSLYYSVYTSYPTVSGATDSVFSWKNPKTGTYKYMVLPADFSAVKRNDVVAADTGKYSYYNIYSAKPTKNADTDKILSIDRADGKVYILVPENYSNDNVTRGLNGEFFAD